MIITYNTPDNPPPTGGGEHGEESDDQSDSPADSNSGTLILDATCAPQNISYPQDVNLLNEPREDLEKIDLCDSLSTQFATIRTLVEQQEVPLHYQL